MKRLFLLVLMAELAGAQFQVQGIESSFEGLGMAGDWLVSGAPDTLNLKYSLPEAEGDVFITLRFDTTGKNTATFGFNEYSKQFTQSDLAFGELKVFVPKEYIKQSNSIRLTATPSEGSSFTLKNSSAVGVYEAPVVLVSKRIDDHSLRKGDVATVTITLENEGLLGYTVRVEDGVSYLGEFIQVIEGGGPKLLTIKSGEEKTYSYALKARKSTSLALPNPLVEWETPPSQGAIVLDESRQLIIIAPAKPFLGVSASPSKNLLLTGENASYSITLKNLGELPVENLQASVTGQGVSVTPSTASLQGLEKGESAELVFNLQSSGAGSAGVECVLEYSAAGEEYEQACPRTELMVQEKTYFNEYVIAGFALLFLFLVALLALRFRIREVEGARKKHLPDQELAEKVFDEKRPWKKR